MPARIARWFRRRPRVTDALIEGLADDGRRLIHEEARHLEGLILGLSDD